MGWLLLYNTVLNGLFLLGLPLWFSLALLTPKWRAGLAEKLGFYAPVFLASLQRLPTQGRVWIHTVSVGEFNAAKPLILALLKRQTPVILTTTTRTSQTLARTFAQQVAMETGTPLPVTYFPFDFPSVLHRWLNIIQPSALVTMETELWPNLAWMTHQLGIRQLLVNGRLSDRSFKGYQRFKPFFSWVLSHPHRFLMQSPQDAQRIIALGAPEERVSVMGSLKFETTSPPAPELIEALQDCLALSPDVPLITFASSHEGEEALFIEVLESLHQRFPTLKAIIAPRHPERFDAVAQLIQRAGFKYSRRSQSTTPAPHAPTVLLLDTMGEVMAAYRLSTVAVVGGSFVPVGGHNPLEPLHVQVPVCFGPHMQNFRAIADTLVLAGAATQLGSPFWDRITLKQALINTLSDFIEQPLLRQQHIQQGQAVLEQHQGACQRAYTALLEELALGQLIRLKDTTSTIDATSLAIHPHATGLAGEPAMPESSTAP